MNYYEQKAKEYLEKQKMSSPDSSYMAGYETGIIHFASFLDEEAAASLLKKEKENEGSAGGGFRSVIELEDKPVIEELESRPIPTNPRDRWLGEVASKINELIRAFNNHVK